MAMTAVLCAGAFASNTHYEATILADGQTLGVASGTLDVTPAADGGVQWTLSDGRFSPATLPHATVVFNASALSGSGTAASGDTIALKDFNATVAQSTGVDVTYRFRMSATLSNGAPRTVAIRQMK
jgi:hypothetical protein